MKENKSSTSEKEGKGKENLNDSVLTYLSTCCLVLSGL